jgi:hypothetical protein
LDGTSLADESVDAEEFEGRRTTVDIKSGAREKRTQLYPPVALQNS